MSDKPSPRSKTERELADLDAVFAALAHPSRRHILLVLHFRGGEMTAGEIADRFACSWPTTTRHLRVLESAKLVLVESRGRERVYHLDSSRLLGVTTRWLNTFSRKASADSKG
jgi:DNA-binding transcriptional ArsR family regulator